MSKESPINHNSTNSTDLDVHFLEVINDVGRLGLLFTLKRSLSLPEGLRG